MNWMRHGSVGQDHKAVNATILAILVIMAPFATLAISSVGQIALAEPSSAPSMDDAYTMSYGDREKDLTFFLHSVNASETSKVVAGHTTDWYMDTTLEFNGTSIITEVTSKTKFTWYLVPVLAGDLNVTHFDFKIWIWATSTLGTPQGNMTVDLYEANQTSWSFVTNATTGDTSFLTTADLRVVSRDLSHVFKAGSTIVVNMTLDLTAGDSITFAFDTARSNSRFLLRTVDGVSIEDIYTLDHDLNSNNTFDPVAANKTIYIDANISDELGGYDVKWVNATLEAADAIILDNVTMTRVVGDNTSLYSIYRLAWNYSGHSNGRYNYTVWLTDNSGHNHYYHLQMYVWDNYTSEDEGFFTIGKMIFLNVEVVDSKDVLMAGALVKIQISGSSDIFATAMTNDTGMYNFTSMFTGTYDFLVIWQGVLVANVTKAVTQNVTEDDPLLIVADVFYPIIRVVDSKGFDLRDATVTVSHPNGTPTADPFSTNATGEFGLSQTANGTYGLSIKWMDVLVNDTNVAITTNDTLTVFTSVYYFAITIVDSRNIPLAGTQVVLANSTSGIVFDSKITNLSGGYEFRLPGGDYDIAVFWQNSLIYSEANYTLDDNTDIEIVGDIFYLIVRVIDTHGEAVETAQVVVTADEGNVLDSNFTDDNGRIDSRLPRGTHWVRAFWYGVMVNMTQVTFTDDTEVIVEAAIFYPDFTILDADDVPVANARVDLTINATGETVESLVTGEDGMVSLRLPSTAYDVHVYWKGVLVHEVLDLMISDDAQTTLNVAVYNLEVICQDSRDEPLKDAHILMTLVADGRELVSVNTDVNGSATMRLPGASYVVEVTWENVQVAYIGSLLIDASGQHVIHGAVYYLEGTALDSRDKPLAGAVVDISDSMDKTLLTLLTGTDGNFTARLPVGSYDVALSWKARPVNMTDDLQLSSDLEIGFDCSVYYLDILPLDSRKAVIQNALITVTSTSSGKTVASDVSGSSIGDDLLTFRLPGDTYDITVHWKEVLVNTTSGYQLAGDASLDLECAVHYVTVLVLDSGGNILTDAIVDIKIQEGERTWSTRTDSTGSAYFRLPAADYEVKVSWKGVTVHDETDRTLSADATWSLDVDVYYPTFMLKDSRGASVGGAHVDIYLVDGGVLLESVDVADDGSLTSRLPATSYRVLCTWLGHQVYDSTIIITSSDTKTLNVEVYYFEPTVQDSRDVPLEDAIIDTMDAGTKALLGTAITDEEGDAVIRLPTGTIDVLVTWRGLNVHMEMGLDIDKDTTKTIDAKVFYLTLTLNDDRSVAAEDALVEVMLKEDLFNSGLSDESGKAVFRLPAASYDTVITWHGVEVGLQEDIGLEQDTDLTKVLSIHYLSVLVKDSEGTKVKGALVTVEKDGVELFGAGQTKGDGKLEFRLPKGQYTVTVSYATTHLMTDYSATLKKDVTLDESLEERFVFSDYPPPVYTTNTFKMSMLSVILIVVLIVVAVKMLRPSKKE